MVKLAGFKAINTIDEEVQTNKEQQTIEAQEAQIIDWYETALRTQKAHDIKNAEVRNILFEIWKCFNMVKFIAWPSGRNLKV